MNVIGHRGCRDHFPENTVEAVRRAAPHVDMVEIDVRRCDSGDLVVFHDSRLGKRTDGRGFVQNQSYDELSRLAVDGSDATIPRLRAVLDALPVGTGINVELKHDGMAEDVAPLLRNVDGEVIVSSFDTAALEPFQNEPVATAPLFAGFFEQNLQTAAELGCEYVHPMYETVDSDGIEAAHSQGIEVNAWTVPTSGAVRRLYEAGVDGVIVDSWSTVPEWFDSPAELEDSTLRLL